MNITFLPGHLGATARNAAIKFGALVDGAVLECEVSEKALREHFGAKSGLRADSTGAFEMGRDQTLAVARCRISNGKSGGCLVDASDFL